MNAREIYGKTMKFVWLKLGMGALAMVISMILLAGAVGLSMLFEEPGAIWVALLVWYILSLITYRLVVGYFGYMIKAAHIAVVSEAVTTGQVPANMIETGKNMVKSRFATANVYLALNGLVSGAVKQLQRAVGKVGNIFDNVPGVSTLVNILQLFIGIALGYIDECCLGYTFFKKDESAFKAGCDGVVIYFQNTKHLLKSAAVTALIVVGLTFVAWLVPFILFAVIISAVLPAFIPGFVGMAFAMLLALIVAISIKSAFIDSYMMVRTMVSYMQVAPSTQITFDLYDKLCKLSGKFRSLFTKAKETTV